MKLRSIREIAENFTTVTREGIPALLKETVRFIRTRDQVEAGRLIHAIVYQSSVRAIEQSQQGVAPFVVPYAQLVTAAEQALEWLELHGGQSLPPNEPGLQLLMTDLREAIDKAQQIPTEGAGLVVTNGILSPPSAPAD